MSEERVFTVQSTLQNVPHLSIAVASRTILNTQCLKQGMATSALDSDAVVGAAALATSQLRSLGIGHFTFKWGGPKWGVRFFFVTSEWRADDAMRIAFDTTNKVV